MNVRVNPRIGRGLALGAAVLAAVLIVPPPPIPATNAGHDCPGARAATFAQHHCVPGDENEPDEKEIHLPYGKR